MRFPLPAILLLAVGCPATTPPPELPPREDPEETPSVSGYLEADFEDVPAYVAREGTPGASGEPVFRTTRGRILDMVFSPDGSGIAFSTSDKVIGLVDAASGELRAYRRVRVRADESIRLVGFDGTGTRLLFLTFGYSESNVYAWDLWTDRYRVIEQEQVEGFGTVAFGGEALVHSGYESNTVRIIKSDAETQRIDLEHEVQRMVGAADRKTVLLETREAVAFLDTNTGGIVAHVEGSIGAVRPGGGLIAIVQDDGTRVVDERGENVAMLRDAEVHFTSTGEIVLDRRDEGTTTIRREILDPRNRETLAELTIEMDIHRHQDEGRVSYAIEDDGRVVVRYDLSTGEPTELFAGWAEGGDATADADGEYHEVNSFELSPARDVLAVGFGNELRILDAASGEQRARYVNGSGESSVWEVDDLENGIGVWGRGWAQIWSASGFHQIRCPGSESGAKLVGGEPAVRSNYRACRGDAQLEPENEESNLILGVHGDRFVERAESQLLLRDFTTGRARTRFRLPDDLEVYCEGGGCSAIYHPASSRSAWLLDNLVSTAYLIGPGRPRALGMAAWGSKPVGDRLFAVVDEGAKLFDTRGREVASLEGDHVAIDDDGTQWVTHQGNELIVQTIAGAERARLPITGEVTSLELFGDAIVTRGDGHITIHNTRGASPVQLPIRTPIAVLPDGSHFVVCEAGSLSLRRVEGEVRRELGDCGLGEQLFLIDPESSASGEVTGFVALDSVTIVDVFNLAGGAPLTLRTNGNVAVAYSDGKFWTTDEHRSDLRWRDAGSILSAPLGPAESHYDAALLSRFFR